MSVDHYTLTLSGAPQALAVGLALILPQDDWAFATLTLQSGPNNVGDIFIGVSGGANGTVPLVTSTSYGLLLAVADPYRRPIVLPAAGGSALRLSDFSVLGTSGDKLFILGIGR